MCVLLWRVRDAKNARKNEKHELGGLIVMQANLIKNRAVIKYHV